MSVLEQLRRYIGANYSQNSPHMPKFTEKIIAETIMSVMNRYEFENSLDFPTVPADYDISCNIVYNPKPKRIYMCGPMLQEDFNTEQALHNVRKRY